MTEEAAAFVSDLLSTVGSFDRVFVSWRQDGIQPPTAQTLDWFWGQPEATALRAVAAGPRLDWDEFTDVVMDLAAAGPTGDEVDWAALAQEALRLANRDPVAAAAVSLYAVAGWMGSRGDRLLRHPPDPGWYQVPPLVGSALLAADAVHGAELLSSRARKFVDQAEREIYLPEFQERLIPLRGLASGIARRRDEDVTALAWDLRGACRWAAPNFRAEVAALFWTVGDVPRAYVVAREAGYVPTLDLMQDLVTVTMARVRDDPLLQYIWLAMKDRPPLDLRRHHRLFARLNARYEHNPVHQVDSLLHVPVSQIYAEALIAHFGDGPSDDQLDVLGADWQMTAQMLGTQEPLVHLRLACLVNLLLSDPGDQSARWQQLTRMATDILRTTVRQGDFTTYHSCLAVPTFYLSEVSPAPERDALAAVEEYRAAGLDYWLTAAAPPSRRYDGMEDLLRSEVGLLDKLRAARFVRLTPHLPWSYQGFTVDIRAAIRHGDLDVHPLDQERAQQAIAETWQQLAELWKRMREASPEYAGLRANPVSQFGEFAHALTATTAPTVLVGPTPVRRTRTDPTIRPETGASAAPALLSDDGFGNSDDTDGPGDPDAPAARRRRADELAAMADSLVERYHRAPDLALLDTAIDAAAEACGLAEEGSEEHLRHLDRLAMIRSGRYLHAGNEADIDAAIAAHETATDLAEADQIPVTLRVMLRFNAAMTRYHRYQGGGTVADLRRAVGHWRAAARAPGIEQEQAMMVFQRYNQGLFELYGHTHDPEVLTERIAALRVAVDVAPQDPNRVGYLATLALELLREHKAGGDVGLVTEAVELLRQAVRLARQADPRNLLPVLNNLALALLARHAESHDDADLDQAIAALDEAAATAPIGPVRARLLESLAALLEQRHAQRGDPADAERAASARSHAAELHER